MGLDETRRRCILQATSVLTTTGLAGCGRRIYDAPDLRIRNHDIKEHEIHVTVGYGGETIVDDTVTLGPRKQTTFDIVFDETGTYEITGFIETGESNTEVVEIETTERDHRFNLTVHEEPTQNADGLITIGGIAP